MQELLAVTDTTGECMVGSACSFLDLAQLQGLPNIENACQFQRLARRERTGALLTCTKLVLVECVAGYAPINVMPHYPPYGHRWGKVGICQCHGYQPPTPGG